MPIPRALDPIIRAVDKKKDVEAGEEARAVAIDGAGRIVANPRPFNLGLSWYEVRNELAVDARGRGSTEVQVRHPDSDAEIRLAIGYVASCPVGREAQVAAGLHGGHSHEAVLHSRLRKATLTWVARRADTFFSEFGTESDALARHLRQECAESLGLTLQVTVGEATEWRVETIELEQSLRAFVRDHPAAVSVGYWARLGRRDDLIARSTSDEATLRGALDGAIKACLERNVGLHRLDTALGDVEREVRAACDAALQVYGLKTTHFRFTSDLSVARPKTPHVLTTSQTVKTKFLSVVCAFHARVTLVDLAPYAREVGDEDLDAWLGSTCQAAAAETLYSQSRSQIELDFESLEGPIRAELQTRLAAAGLDAQDISIHPTLSGDKHESGPITLAPTLTVATTSVPIPIRVSLQISVGDRARYVDAGRPPLAETVEGLLEGHARAVFGVRTAAEILGDQASFTATFRQRLDQNLAQMGLHIEDYRLKLSPPTTEAPETIDAMAQCKLAVGPRSSKVEARTQARLVREDVVRIAEVNHADPKAEANERLASALRHAVRGPLSQLVLNETDVRRRLRQHLEAATHEMGYRVDGLRLVLEHNEHLDPSQDVMVVSHGFSCRVGLREIALESDIKLERIDPARFVDRDFERLDAWARQCMEQVTRSILFPRSYSELIEAPERIREEVRAELEKKARVYGYRIDYVTMLPDAEIAPGGHFTIEGRYRDLATGVQDTTVGLDLAVGMHIDDLAAVRPIIDRGDSAKEEIEREIERVVKAELHRMDPNDFLFAFKGGEQPQSASCPHDILHDSICERLKRFGATDPSVSLKPVKPTYVSEAEELTGRVITLSVELASTAQRPSAAYSGRFRVEGIKLEGRHFLSKGKPDLEEVTETLRDRLRSRLVTFDAMLLLDDARALELEGRVRQETIQFAPTAFGLGLVLESWVQLEDDHRRALGQRWDQTAQLAIRERDTYAEVLRQLNEKLPEVFLTGSREEIEELTAKKTMALEMLEALNRKLAPKGLPEPPPTGVASLTIDPVMQLGTGEEDVKTDPHDVVLHLESPEHGYATVSAGCKVALDVDVRATSTVEEVDAGRAQRLTRRVHQVVESCMLCLDPGDLYLRFEHGAIGEEAPKSMLVAEIESTLRDQGLSDIVVEPRVRPNRHYERYRSLENHIIEIEVSVDMEGRAVPMTVAASVTVEDVARGAWARFENQAIDREGLEHYVAQVLGDRVRLKGLEFVGSELRKPIEQLEANLGLIIRLVRLDKPREAILVATAQNELARLQRRYKSIGEELERMAGHDGTNVAHKVRILEGERARIGETIREMLGTERAHPDAPEAEERRDDGS